MYARICMDAAQSMSCNIRGPPVLSVLGESIARKAPLAVLHERIGIAVPAQILVQTLSSDRVLARE